MAERGHVVIIGSGAGASVAAWALTAGGWSVTTLEKGKNYFSGLADPLGLGPPAFGNDEVRNPRGFPGVDVLGAPRTGRRQGDARAGRARSFVGDINIGPMTVGGATTHWDAGVPRFWRMDFELLSRYGAMPGADVADWPFGYDDLAPYYDRIEELIGVAGDAEALPDFVRAEAPRPAYQMPALAPMYAAVLAQQGAERLGYQPHPSQSAINSRAFDGRPPCVHCGYCDSHGCPIHARGGGAVTFLRRALLGGARLVTRAMVTRIRTDASARATGVDYLAGAAREPAHIEADHVVLAASAIETARIALLSDIPNANDLIGRYLCFHTITNAAGQMNHRVHPHRGRNSDGNMAEPCVPVTDNTFAKWLGLPYMRGGICWFGGAPRLIEEAQLYDGFPLTRGRRHKQLMRASPLRDHMITASMHGEDLPQRANQVDLDPDVRDVYGLPVARITYTPHLHDRIASWSWGAELTRILRAAGARNPYYLPTELSELGGDSPIAAQSYHQAGTMRMGTDPDTSVTDEFGRIHEVPNVIVCDGAVFPTSGAFNPTLTIMATALRSATALAASEARARTGPDA